MGYPDKPPPDGLRLRAELAEGEPVVSRDGKTYTFTVRKGARFSTGAAVTARAFARALERRDASEVGRLLGGAQTAAIPRARLMQWLNGTRQVAATVVWVGDVSRIDGQWTVPFRLDVRWIVGFGARDQEQASFRALLARGTDWRLTGVAPSTAFPAR